MSESLSLNIPALMKGGDVQLRPLIVDLSATKVAESRLLEAKDVNPATYTDLEYCFNESYRELKRALASVQYEIGRTQNAMDNIKAELLIDKYPAFMEGKPKSQDNADLRKAFVQRDKDYQQALDRLQNLSALETLIEGRIKVMERVTSYMRKKMDLIIRAGYNPGIK